MASGSDLLPSTTVIATYNILAKSLGSNCIPWAIEIPPRLREKLEKATGKPWDAWRKEILHAAYKAHFHKNLHSGDYMTMRALWSATECKSALDIPSSLKPNITWVREDVVAYHDGEQRIEAMTLRGLLRKSLASEPKLARELFDAIVERDLDCFAWDLRGPRLFRKITGGWDALSDGETAPAAEVIALQEYDCHVATADYRGIGAEETFVDAMASAGYSCAFFKDPNTTREIPSGLALYWKVGAFTMSGEEEEPPKPTCIELACGEEVFLGGSSFTSPTAFNWDLEEAFHSNKEDGEKVLLGEVDRRSAGMVRLVHTQSGQALWICTAHLMTSSRDDETCTDYPGEVRAGELSMIRQKISEHVPQAKGSFIFCGDFNASPSSMVFTGKVGTSRPVNTGYDDVNGSFGWSDASGIPLTLQDAFINQHQMGGNVASSTTDAELFSKCCTSRNADRVAWIDYIFYTPLGLNVLQLSSAAVPKEQIPSVNQPSDHIPLAARFELLLPTKVTDPKDIDFFEIAMENVRKQEHIGQRAARERVLLDHNLDDGTLSHSLDGPLTSASLLLDAPPMPDYANLDSPPRILPHMEMLGAEWIAKLELQKPPDDDEEENRDLSQWPSVNLLEPSSGFTKYEDAVAKAESRLVMDELGIVRERTKAARERDLEELANEKKERERVKERLKLADEEREAKRVERNYEEAMAQFKKMEEGGKEEDKELSPSSKVAAGHLLSPREMKDLKREDIGERLEAGHMLSPRDMRDLRKDEMEEKLEAGHMLSPREIKDLKKDGIEERLEEGHMLSGQELTELRMDEIEEKVSEGHMLSGEELTELKMNSKSASRANSPRKMEPKSPRDVVGARKAEAMEALREDEAATKVQATVRGQQARRGLSEGKEAAEAKVMAEEVAAADDAFEAAAEAETEDAAAKATKRAEWVASTASLLGSIEMSSHADHVRPIELLDELYDTSGSWDLGAGANGAVRTITKRSNGKTFALKTMPPDLELHGDEDTALRKLLEDVEMQRSLEHPNIAPVLDVFLNRDTREVSFVMALASGGSLSRFLTHHPNLSEGAKAVIARKMISAVRYCHEQSICHRDIKLENFVFESTAEDAEVMLIDFGMAYKMTPGELIEDGCSTFLYMAPEMFYLYHVHVAKTGGSVLYDTKVDMWALGVTIFQMLYGIMPLGLGEDPSEEEEEIADRIVYEPLAFPGEDEEGEGDGGGVSEDARAFLHALLQRDAKDRPSATEALSAKWITSHQDAKITEDSGVNGTAVVDGLLNFSEANVLKKAAYHALAKHAGSVTGGETKLKEVRAAFAEMDSDGDGKISKEEFSSVISKFPEMASLNAEGLFNAIDSMSGGSGQLEWRWFLAATMSSFPSKKGGGGGGTPGIVDAFLELDRDGDGFLDVSDITAALRSGQGGESAGIDEAALKKLLSEASGKGEEEPKITLDDFKALMMGSLGEEAQQLSASLNSATRASTRWKDAVGKVAKVNALAAGSNE